MLYFKTSNLNKEKNFPFSAYILLLHYNEEIPQSKVVDMALSCVAGSIISHVRDVGGRSTKNGW